MYYLMEQENSEQCQASKHYWDIELVKLLHVFSEAKQADLHHYSSLRVIQGSLCLSFAFPSRSLLKNGARAPGPLAAVNKDGRCLQQTLLQDNPVITHSPQAAITVCPMHLLCDGHSVLLLEL